MSLLTELMEDVEEASFVIRRFQAIRDGKKVMVRKRKYSGPELKDGYKRDPNTGKAVRMSPQERRKRSIAAKKVARKSSVLLKRMRSMKRHKATIGG